RKTTERHWLRYWRYKVRYPPTCNPPLSTNSFERAVVIPAPDRLLVRGRCGCRNDVFWELRRRGTILHGVSVFHTETVRSKMVLYDVHDRVIRVFRRPIALPLEHDRKRRDRLCARLHHALHRVLVGQLA